MNVISLIINFMPQEKKSSLLFIAGALVVGVLAGGAAGYYLGYDRGWEGAVAETTANTAQASNPYANVQTNPLENVKTNPYSDVKINPFD